MRGARPRSRGQKRALQVRGAELGPPLCRPLGGSGQVTHPLRLTNPCTARKISAWRGRRLCATIPRPRAESPRSAWGQRARDRVRSAPVQAPAGRGPPAPARALPRTHSGHSSPASWGRRSSATSSRRFSRCPSNRHPGNQPRRPRQVTTTYGGLEDTGRAKRQRLARVPGAAVWHRKGRGGGKGVVRPRL